ncbi:hypothetical protein [Streptomyces johnsoniae]|uniref:Uncharacterized protein n=1 Tax=Streptomyces johnsoniae TaxID=3075532 RepID=A0ABU2RW79_9ACTN|nr:hypothetical protein [Streptomyces sp. DSM 41886]MDT0441002.1 hypothetical protein [Streptomyces sp. DSM 41886]
MSEHELEKHEVLAGLVARADPGAVETRARALLEMVPMIREVGDLIAARVAAMEWRGEAAEVVRAWGDHFRQESATLSEYAERVGGAMTVAGQVLAKVKSAMPPTRPSPLVPLADASGFEQTMAEVDRQEAIRLIDSLDSAYRLASDAMSRAPEPRFEPFTGLEDDIRPPVGASGPSGPAGAPASTHFGSASVYAAGGGEWSQGFSTMPPSTPSVPSEFVSGATTPNPVPSGDEWIGTSLDSLASGPDTRAPVGPATPPAPSPVAPPVGGAENMQFPVANPQWRDSPRPAGGGPLRTPQPNTQQPAFRPTVNPVSNVHSSTAHSGGHPVGGGSTPQSPMAGRPPMTGFPGSRMPRDTEHGGILGGVPRQPDSYRRALPQNGIISAGAPPAFRDPATGAVRGPGGALVGRPASQLGDESRSYGSRTGTEQTTPRRGAFSSPSTTSGITGRPSPPANGRRRKRRRNEREQQEKDR